MPLSPEVIGRIILARFLSLSPSAYEAALDKVESSPLFQALCTHLIVFKRFPRAGVTQSDLAPEALASIQRKGGGLFILYRRIGFAGEYLFQMENLDDPGLCQDLSGSVELTVVGGPAQIVELRRKLRLINTRNKLTQMVLLGLLQHQEAYLKSGDLLKLKPLTQLRLVDWIKSQGYRPLDPSMISRLVGHSAIITPWGELKRLKELFPSRAEISEALIRKMLEEEKYLTFPDGIEACYTDQQIQKRLELELDYCVSRRWVTRLRHLMGIPPSWQRRAGYWYPPKWAQLSRHFPLTPAAVSINAPEAAGVYEMATAEFNIDYPGGITGIFYIGRARNLRRRLKFHLGSNHKNKELKSLIKGHRCLFRFARCQDSLRGERELLQAFVQTYGRLPLGNKTG